MKHLWERTNFWDLNSILLVLQLIMFSYLLRSQLFRPEGETCLGAKESTNQQMASTNCQCLVVFPKCLFITKNCLHNIHLFNTFYISLGVFNPSERYSSLVYFNSMLISRCSGLRPRRCGRSKASPTYQADRISPSSLGNSSIYCESNWTSGKCIYWVHLIYLTAQRYFSYWVCCLMEKQAWLIQDS